MLSTAILDRLDAHWAKIGNVFVATTSKQIWLDLGVDEETLGGRFGWCWPAAYHDPDRPDHNMIIGYCPELIAEIIAHLDDEDRDEYLNAVEYLTSMFMADIERADDPTFREELFENLAKNFPYTAQLVNDVEERAIALGIVPAEPGGAVASHALCSACGYVSPAGTKTCLLCASAID